MDIDYEALPEPVRHALDTAGLVYLVTTAHGRQRHRTGRVQHGEEPDGTACPVLVYGTKNEPERLYNHLWTDTVVAGVRPRDERHYLTPDNLPAAIPGVNYRDVKTQGGVDHRVMPGRPRVTDRAAPLTPKETP